MSLQTTYPGVYVEEIPSGVRTITGVATSITAFIGRTLSGPTNEPITINNFGDFERKFGGLWVNSTMSYAVRDFYQNGGSQAIIVRISNGATSAQIQLATELDSPPGPLVLFASSEGIWGNNLGVEINYNTGDPTASSSPPVTPDPNLFNLVVYLNGVKIEDHQKVTMDPLETRYLPRVLATSSGLLTIPEDSPGSGTWSIPAGRPVETTTGTPQGVTTNGNDGTTLTANEYLGSESDQTGIYALKQTDLFNLLCIPPPERRSNTDPSVYQAALTLCVTNRAMLIVDPFFEWGASVSNAVQNAISGLGDFGLSGTDARNAVLYYPRVIKADPLRENQFDVFVPCGIMSGVMSKTDTNRGVWKSPAGIDAGLNGIQGLQANFTDAENGQLNPLGINVLRSFPVTGRVAWGARTMRGADVLADEYKYLSVRRTALFISESLYRGTQWVVFEPNDEPLWAQIRLNVGAFMHNLFRQGAFQGTTPKQAYLVKCDSETTTQNDINLGVVNILVGFAPLKPAEFVIIKLQQLAGQVDS